MLHNFHFNSHVRRIFFFRVAIYGAFRLFYFSFLSNIHIHIYVHHTLTLCSFLVHGYSVYYTEHHIISVAVLCFWYLTFALGRVVVFHSALGYQCSVLFLEIKSLKDRGT